MGIRAQPLIEWPQMRDICTNIVTAMRTDGWLPDIVIGLSASGFFVAVPLAKRLSVAAVVGLDVRKDQDGTRHLGGVVQLTKGLVQRKRVLGVGGTIITGRLFADLTAEITWLGGEPRMAALVGVGDYPQLPHMYVGCELHQVPIFPWADLLAA